MHLIDILILFAFIGYAIYSGFKEKDAAGQNLEEYFLAGRTIRGWRAGISMAATQFAADTPLLVTGLIATAGIFSLWQLWSYAVAFLMMGFLLSASWRRAGVLTDAELTELRYGKKPAAFLRGMKAVYLGVFFNCTVLAMVLFAATAIAQPFLFWNQWLPAWFFDPIVSMVQTIGIPMPAVPAGVPITEETWISTANNLLSIMLIVSVTTFYSTTGGLRSVINTDVVQFGIMLIATALYAWILVDQAGGLAVLPDKIRMMFAGGGPAGITPDQILAFTPESAKNASLAVLAVFAIQWIAQINADGTGYLAQRSMACRSDKDAVVAAVVFTVTQIVIRSLFWIPTALALLVLFPPDLSLPLEAARAAREQTFVTGISELLPPGIMGLMVTGMLAALASTVDTHLNWGSSYLSNDIYKRFICQSWLKKEPDPRLLVWVARGSNLLILGLALIIMTQLSSIQTAWKTSLLIGGGVGITLVLRWVWWRFNAWGEIAALAASFLTVFWVLFTPGTGFPLAAPEMGMAMRLLVVAGTATLAAVATCYIMGPEEDAKLAHFYAKVRPPGFWGPVIAQLGGSPADARRIFFRDISTVAISAISIFAILIGFGSWMADSPVPGWFPVESLWIPFLLVLGFGLVPVWWTLGFKKQDIYSGLDPHEELDPLHHQENADEEPETASKS